MSSSNIDNDIKNITIRGVDMEIYDIFTNKLRDYNLNIGEAFNKMMNDVLKDFDSIFQESSTYDFIQQKKRLPKVHISSHQTLVISDEDLLSTKSRISFHNIDNLKFDSTVTKEIFLKHVDRIQNCTLVQFGQNFPKLLALAYCNNCDTVEFVT